MFRDKTIFGLLDLSQLPRIKPPPLCTRIKPENVANPLKRGDLIPIAFEPFPRRCA
jgi:hypothetical protein